MKRIDLLKRLRAVKHTLADAAVWSTHAAVDTGQDSYVFEFLCFLNLCAELEAGHELEVVTRKKKAVWPKGPALKCNFSYARITPKAGGAHEYDLNPGIKISDRYGKLRAPDISITEKTGDATPAFGQVTAIWDAKFSERAGSPIGDTNVSDFLYTAQQLGFPRVPPGPFRGVGGGVYARSGLITNAQPSSEPDQVYVDHGMHEVSGFPLAIAMRPAYPAAVTAGAAVAVVAPPAPVANPAAAALMALGGGAVAAAAVAPAAAMAAPSSAGAVAPAAAVAALSSAGAAVPAAAAAPSSAGVAVPAAAAAPSSAGAVAPAAAAAPSSAGAAVPTAAAPAPSSPAST
ncbi:hypothetical protein KTF56_21955 [Burkholderia gladioli]|uniref:hypothetical protein n=1 Tax=Burkholderia gladioli TaxID=28095 RepID=UPI001C221203|nr:hypothetical protein [Burkholderia gladioli]MBU9685551.1 hypothetical protein [Burkholderia gladioli]MDN7716929.1 hypothetical protein [Burkholderia gladioli]